MKKQVISLDGLWTLAGVNETGEPITLPITVPGYVHPTLEAAGVISPMYWRDNAKKCQWIEEKTWEFTREFDLPAGVDPAAAELVFGGVDTYAEYELNGMPLGRSDDMFLPVRFAVGHLLREKGNLLRVTVHPWREFVSPDLPPVRMAFSSYERGYIRRTQCTFFWDWVERFVSAGVWQSVSLVLPAPAAISAVSVATKSILSDFASLELRFETDGARAKKARFAIVITAPDGKTVWQEKGRVFLDRIDLQADVKNPALWWPHGYGEQPLYTLTATLLSEDGEVWEERVTRFGIRTVQFLFPKDEPGSEEEKRSSWTETFRRRPAPERTGEGMILVVNGVRVYATGGNWVPPTPFPGHGDRAIYENLVRLAAEGNCNFLRVWGGGIYETDYFYDLCDEYGVMVSQDLIMSCGDYPYEDPHFRAQIAAEMRYAMRRLRNHPSLIFWSGNNENCADFDWDDPAMKTTAITEEVLLPIAREEDPARVFRFGSPFGGKGNNDFIIGDNHVSWWWTGAEKMTHNNFECIARFVTESPLEGYSLPSTLKKFLSDEDIANPTGEVFEYHIKNNDYFTEVLKWPSVHGRLMKNAEVMLGKWESEEERLYRSAYVQYEWARFTVEAARRAKWYNAALQYWMYNDCWPAVGYAIIDFYGKPKAGWYASRRAFAPVAGAIRCEEDGNLTFHVLNDGREAHDLTYRILAADMQTGELTVLGEGAVPCPAGENRRLYFRYPTEGGCLGKLLQKGSGILFFELYEKDVLLDRARWYPTWLSNVACEKAELAYTVDEAACTVTVTCRRGVALGVAFDGDCIFEDNFFDLFPGETKCISYRPLAEKVKVTPYAYNGKF